MYVVAGLTERLPIVLVPEKLHITTMRGDVIDYRSLDVLAALEVIGTEWVVAQVAFTCLLPLVSVQLLDG